MCTNCTERCSFINEKLQKLNYWLSWGKLIKWSKKICVIWHIIQDSPWKSDTAPKQVTPREAYQVIHTEKIFIFHLLFQIIGNIHVKFEGSIIKDQL